MTARRSKTRRQVTSNETPYCPIGTLFHRFLFASTASGLPRGPEGFLSPAHELYAYEVHRYTLYRTTQGRCIGSEFIFFLSCVIVSYYELQ